MDDAVRKQLTELYQQASTIAVVGASFDETKPSNRIPLYMQMMGFRVIPINPRGGELFGETVYTSLSQVPHSIDIVDVFRPSAEAAAITEQAIAAGAWAVWLQLGITSAAAASIADRAEIMFVQDRCIGATYAQLGLGPSPSSVLPPVPPPS